MLGSRNASWWPELSFCARGPSQPLLIQLLFMGKGNGFAILRPCVRFRGASWKQEGAGRSREGGDPTSGWACPGEWESLRPCPYPSPAPASEIQAWPTFVQTVAWFAGRWWGSLRVWCESHSASHLPYDPGSSPFISLYFSFLLYKMGKLTEPASLEAQMVKNLPAKQKMWFDPWVGRSPGEGNVNPRQDSCLEIPWTEKPGGATVHGLQESHTQLSD